MTDQSVASLSFSAVGDVSLGDHPVCVGHGMRTAFEKEGANVLAAAQPYFRKSDVALANLETVTTNRGFNRFWLPSFEMRGNPNHLGYLKSAGIGVVGVANNHAMQHGRNAFEDMTASLHEQGLSVIGLDNESSRTNCHEYVHETGERSLFVAFSMRPEEWTKDPVKYSLRENFADLLEEVRSLRSECDGFLVCSMHWGLEFIDFPSEQQVAFGRALIDSGVDVVLGHHPHVLQPIERYKNGLIFYSLGNFVFDLWGRQTKLTGIANVVLRKGAEPAFEFVPMVIGDSLTLEAAGQEDAKEIDSLLSWDRFANLESRPKTESEYVELYKAARKTFRYSSYRYFLKNFYKYPFHFFVQSLARTALRRLTGT
ncbi:CapA family protein [Marinobacter sp. JSM 1782161]|uniref:CapA family protein n=1 Tax=Marinobacter sp. JSM 1782161 TaxID=2685906 RepID=UPI0014025F8C|nr:CapA family protein [Marinobacter sp. JSM 1782161]